MGDDKNIFDPTEILENLMDDKEVAGMIIDGFLVDIPEQIEQLQQALDIKDLEVIERQAHTIKGACANVGAKALQALAYEMEKAGKAGDVAAVQKDMPELSNSFQTLKGLMEITVKEWQG